LPAFCKKKKKGPQWTVNAYTVLKEVYYQFTGELWLPRISILGRKEMVKMSKSTFFLSSLFGENYEFGGLYGRREVCSD
jgi:hypothetical protein